MSPQARAKLPPELGRLTRKDMEAVIYQANLGRENEKIAQLYFVDKLPQVDVATELFLGRAPVRRRPPAAGDHGADEGCVRQSSKLSGNDAQVIRS